jgi:hypothetical protein
MHNINIEDDNDNWSRWGNLVASWINDKTITRPATVGDLRAAMKAAGVIGIVEGDDSRGVTFVDYKDTGPIVIPLPTAAMVKADVDLLDGIAMHPPGQRRYPLPTFYAVAFGGLSMVDLGQSELQVMARRRLGEYVINECM